MDAKDYPRYLKKIFYKYTNQKLNLKNPKNFNEKIQWLKLNDTTNLKTVLTDKVLVRDFVKEKISEKYLKPVLWIGNNFDDIPFDELPERFIIKANNGCKWHFKILNKTEFLENRRLFDIVKRRFDGWMYQTFFVFCGFELQYKNIVPKILIEPLMVTELSKKPVEYEIYCFNGKPKIFQKIIYSDIRYCSVYDENYNQIDLKFRDIYEAVQEPPSENLKLAVELSQKLCLDFKLVRCDWFEYLGDLYFEEMTFTPFSGFYKFEKEEWNLRLGNMLSLK